MNSINKCVGWIGGVAWGAFWVGIAVADIGEMSEPSEPYSWYLPLLVAAFLIPTFVFGLIAGGSNEN